jgi:two-component system response regulator HydG
MMSPKPNASRPGTAAAGAGHDHPLTLEDFHTEDAAMAACLRRALVAAVTDLPVLLLGESGTGKTILARALHNSSRRSAGPFIAFDGGALSDTLLDSQLFGHERGAFTGAHQSVKGRFELADGGTLFIDEIGDLSAAAQGKILRAVEYGEFERLGSETLRVADVRLISATHFPLPQLAQSERFRRDLFYRISGIVVKVPPLRDRPRDLRLLIASEVGRASSRQRKSISGLHPIAADLLFAYSWPGNLRELSRVIQSAVALSHGDIIDPDALLLDGEPVASAGNDAGRGAGVDMPTLAEVERRHILAVLEKCGGNRRRAARMLDVSRSTLQRKLADLPDASSRGRSPERDS